MEFYSHELLDDDNTPEKDGEDSKSKKKKKKSGIFPLPVKTEPTKKEADSDLFKPKKQEFFVGSEQVEESSEDDPDQPKEFSEEEVLELPEETTELEAETPFLGELIIDHTDEVVKPEELEPEGSIIKQPEAPSVGNDLPEPEHLQPNASAEQVPPAESSTPNAEFHRSPPADVELVDSAEQYTRAQEFPVGFAHEEPIPSGLLPDNISLGKMLNPSEWRAGTSTTYESQEEAGFIPVDEASRRTRLAERRSFGRGFGSGALTGWWFGRRSAARRQEHQPAQPLPSYTQATERSGFSQVDLDKTLKKRETAFQRAVDHLRSFTERGGQAPLAEQRPSAPASYLEATPQMVGHSETTPGPRSVPELPEVKPQPVYRPEVAEQFTPAPAPVGHRFETSAWHRIEVDEKTGRPVENPLVEYGEAFQQEQQQERLAREAAKAQAAARIAAAMHLSSSSKPLSHTQKTTPGPQRAPQAVSGPLVSPQTMQFVKAKLIQDVSNPITWVVALIALILLKVTNII